MDALMAASQGTLALLKPVADSAFRMSSDAGQGQDLYMVWKAVFGREHAITANPPLPPPDSSASHAAVANDLAAQSNDAARQAPTPELATAPDAVAPIGLMSDEVDSHPGMLSAWDLDGGGSLDASAGASFPEVIDSPATKSGTSRSDARNTTELTTPRLEPSGSQGSSTESINITIRDSAVAIVIRDATLTPQTAISCAFETARQLTGRAVALERLTLNGRILHEMTPTESTRRASCSSVLAFEC